MTKNYFTIDEMCASTTAKQKGINNTPDATVKAHLTELIQFLNPLREAWGSPLVVSSGYRSPELNKAVGGVATSAHVLGYAADLQPANGRFNDFIVFVKDYLKDKKFDQAIIETSNGGKTKWLHLGLKNQAWQQRKQIFNLNV